MDGGITEANFGTDDETMRYLEDIGIAGSDEVGMDITNQQSPAAKQRRQASRMRDTKEDFDDVMSTPPQADLLDNDMEANMVDSDLESDPDSDTDPYMAGKLLLR